MKRLFPTAGRSISHRVARVTVATTAVALLTVAALLFANDWVEVRKVLVDRTTSTARIVATQSSAALMFQDEAAATELLTALRAVPSITLAVLYGKDGRAFAHYRKAGPYRAAIPPVPPEGERHAFEDGHALVFEAVMHGGERVGTVHVRGSSQEIQQRFLRYAGVLCVVTLGAALLALALAAGLQRRILQPVHDLAVTMEDVARHGAHRKRAREGGEGELAVLASGFNRMLDELQQRDAELERNRLELEATVARRTAELAAANSRLQAELAERSLLQEQFAHAQKMEAVGRLAGGVAHDFNNILSVVVSYAALLADDLPEGSDARDTLEEIALAGRRGASLTRQLLAFSRKQAISPQALQVEDVIAGVTRMVTRVIGEHIELDVRLGGTVGSVFMDPTQLEQILVNLAVNARDAMPKGGVLGIEASHVVVSPAEATASRPAGDFVCIRVSDTGSGIPPELLGRIFEPFFTTKPAGKGTGLGLAMVYGAMQQGNGRVEVESRVGAGTTFTLWFPRTAGAEAARRAGPALTPVPGHGERILLVEDDAALRCAMRRMLEASNYHVVEAANGEEGLAAYVERGPVRLVVTDAVMPGMSGFQLGRELAVRDPALPVLYVSGYSEESLAGDHVPPQDRMLAKPFEREALLGRIRALLDLRRAA